MNAIALYRRAIKEGFVDRTKRNGKRRVYLHVPEFQGTDFNDQWLAVVGQAARAIDALVSERIAIQ